ncbi:hypothetical protein [uncultured Aeromicrobium sp.]|uniref:hypothetical protein n=1 Tax=uncultured Aeromicrobium sp. TaxID=337820 RepID=UPI0025E4499A|nr:hypothetical protein [uncultured Aeromicrobium sp.]
MIVNWFLIGVLVIELAALLRAGLGGTNAPSRIRLTVVVLEALVTVVVVRALVGWDQWTQWIWVLGVAVFCSGLGLAALRWSELPIIHSGSATWRTAVTVAYAAVLVAISGAVTLTFV